MGAAEDFLEDVAFQKDVEGNDAMNTDLMGMAGLEPSAWCHLFLVSICALTECHRSGVFRAVVGGSEYRQWLGQERSLLISIESQI